MNSNDSTKIRGATRLKKNNPFLISLLNGKPKTKGVPRKKPPNASASAR